MKLAHNRVSKRVNTKAKSAYCDSLMAAGIIILTLGSLINTFALAFGNQVFLASMGSVTVIINCGLSVLCLKERLFKVDMVGILIACIGSTLFMVQAKDTGEDYTPDQLFDLYTRPVSFIFMVFFTISAFGTYTLDTKVRTQLKACYASMKLDKSITPTINDEEQGNLEFEDCPQID